MNASFLEASQLHTTHVVWLQHAEGAVLLVAALVG